MAGNVARRPNGKWRAHYRDAAGREHARHFDRKIDATRWLASVEVAKTRGEWVDPDGEHMASSASSSSAVAAAGQS